GQFLFGDLFLLQGIENFLGFGVHDIVLLVHVEPGGDHGNGNGLPEVLVLPDPHDDVGTVPGLDLDVVVALPDLIDGDLPYPGYHQEQDVFGATDLVIVEQGGIQSAHDGLMGPGTARSGGGTHDGGAGIGKYRLGVPEVDVLGVVVGDDL